jgi:NAD(P)-dependent dehydrogenase (short-subunit alcohol dehydrogenase family)
MSVSQRKKQGITTVSPPKKAKKKPKVIKKTARKIHYDVGQVDVEVNHSHMNKLRILKMTMENWQYSEGAKLPLDSTDKYLLEDWNKTYELNTTSVFLMCKYGIPVIKDGGKIINISSISAKSGGAEGGMAYASSKAAVDCMTKSLAKELASRNICVNAVSPGVVYTKQHEKFSSEEYYNSLIEKIPLGRDGKTSDISNLVTFLCSDESNYITGQVIEINGGMLMK